MPYKANTNGSADSAQTTQQPASWVDTTPIDHIRNLLHVIGISQERREQDVGTLLPALEKENAELREKLEAVSYREANARYLATHDGLTGLANRSLLMDRFIQTAAHAQRNQRPVALLVFDLDGFKAINDNYGHLIGDRLLQRIAHELEDIARAGDTACRYGGDEFVLLLASVDWLQDARLVASKVHARIVDFLRQEDIPVDVTASCGIAMYPDDGDNWHALMEAADIAMYEDKPRATHGASEAEDGERGPRPPPRSHARANRDGSGSGNPTREYVLVGNDIQVRNAHDGVDVEPGAAHAARTIGQHAHSRDIRGV